MAIGSKPGPRNIGIRDLLHYRFPIMAIASILHRLSGFVLFLMIPFILWLLEKSLESPLGFLQVQQGFSCWIIKFFTWVLLSALWFHLIAGIKHLVMDLGHWESKLGGKISSISVLVLALIGIVFMGVWLW